MNIQAITTLKWAKARARVDKRYSRFIEFGYQFLECVRGQRSEKWWVTGHIMKRLISLEQSHSELWRRYGKALAYLKHIDAADGVYKITLEISPNHYWTNLGYAYFMMMRDRFSDAEIYFHKAMKVSRYKDKDRNLYVGLARTMEELSQPNKAEYYFKLSIANHDSKEDPARRRWNNYKHKTFYEPAHFFYGSFLQKQGRYEEAKQQFEICVSKASNAINHYRLSDVLYKLKEFDGYEYHLKKALECDPYMPMARSSWRNYCRRAGGKVDVVTFKKMQSRSIGTKGSVTGILMKGGVKETKKDTRYGECVVERKSDEMEDIMSESTVEFDRFWFDEIGITTPKFNGYYDKFVECGLNDVRCIVDGKVMENILRDEIGVRDGEDLMVICERFNEFRRSLDCNRETVFV